MSRFLLGTRYLIIIPIIGLAIAAAFFFVFGGLGLISLLAEYARTILEPASEAHISHDEVIIHVVEYVHTFLVGTVLYLTAVGLFQLFIKEVEFHGWLKIQNTEELETNLIGVTVVVLAVNFMGAAFSGETRSLLEYGTAIALPIAALGLFVGLRAWSVKIGKEHGSEHKDKASSAHSDETDHDTKMQE